MKATRYPWDYWFARKRSYTLRKGRDHDFTCQVHSMAQQIRNEAQRRGVSVSIEINGREIRVTNK